jgi:hypothetical protein
MISTANVADLPLSAGRSCCRQRLARGKGRKAISLAMGRWSILASSKGFFAWYRMSLELKIVCCFVDGRVKKSCCVLFIICSNNEESQTKSLLAAAPGPGAPLLRTSHAQTGSRGMLSLLLVRWRAGVGNIRRVKRSGPRHHHPTPPTRPLPERIINTIITYTTTTTPPPPPPRYYNPPPTHPLHPSIS